MGVDPPSVTEERAPYLKYWSARRTTLEALKRDLDNISTSSFAEIRVVQEFAHNVDDILIFFQDVLMPRKLEAHLDDGFQAVREALWRRLRAGE